MSQWARWHLKSPASKLFNQPFIQAQIRENIKVLRHWPLWGEFTITGEFPTQRARNAENVSIWWHHHVLWIHRLVCVKKNCLGFAVHSTVECCYNVIQYCKILHNNYRNWGRISIRCWIHKRHSIPRPIGQAMGCLLWMFVRKLTTL